MMSIFFFAAAELGGESIVRNLIFLIFIEICANFLNVSAMTIMFVTIIMASSSRTRTEYSHKIRPISYLIHTRNMFEMYAN